MAEHYIKEEEFNKVQEHLKVLELDPEVKTISEDEYIRIGTDLLTKPEVPCSIPIGEFRKVSFPITGKDGNFDGFSWEYLLGGANGAIGRFQETEEKLKVIESFRLDLEKLVAEAREKLKPLLKHIPG